MTSLINELYMLRGHFIEWTASGRAGEATQYPQLQVWRANSSQGQSTYYKPGEDIQIDTEGSACEKSGGLRDSFSPGTKCISNITNEEICSQATPKGLMTEMYTWSSVYILGWLRRWYADSADG